MTLPRAIDHGTPDSVLKQELLCKPSTSGSHESERGGTELHEWMEAEADVRELRKLTRQLAQVERRLVAGACVHPHLSSVQHARRGCPEDSFRFSVNAWIGNAGEIWVVDRNATCCRCVEVWHTSKIGFQPLNKIPGTALSQWAWGVPGRVWAKETLVWGSRLNADADVPPSASCGP